MDVLCIFPVVNAESKIMDILQAFKNGIFEKFASLGANVQIKHAGLDYAFVGTGEICRIPKGAGILDCIKNANPIPDYIIMCDGSGKIPYKNIVDIFQCLISDSSIYCVMADRTGENKAIDKVRFLIEKFEVFLLRKFFKHELDVPDGQCGLWGFYAKKISINGNEKQIILTAKEYDIELDLLSEVLCKKIKYAFVSVELPIQKNTITAFTFSNNLKKMGFLTKKYPEIAKQLLPLLKEFSIIQKQELDSLSSEQKKYWADYFQQITNYKLSCP